MLIFFHILVLPEYWVLTESRIPLKTVLGGVKIVALSLVRMNRLNKTEFAVFLNCMSLYFGRIRFSRLFKSDPMRNETVSLTRKFHNPTHGTVRKRHRTLKFVNY